MTPALPIRVASSRGPLNRPDSNQQGSTNVTAAAFSCTVHSAVVKEIAQSVSPTQKSRKKRTTALATKVYQRLIYMHEMHAAVS